MTENNELQAEQDSHQKILVADDEASIRRILEARLGLVLANNNFGTFCNLYL